MGRESFRVIRRVRVFGDSDTVCTQRQRRGLISAQGIVLGAKPDAEYGYRPCRGMDPALSRGMTGMRVGRARCMPHVRNDLAPS